MPIVGSPRGSLEPYPDGSLYDAFTRCATKWSDRTALVNGHTGVEHTYSEVASGAAALGRVLQDRGVLPGDRVAIIAPNSPEWVVTFFGAQAAGATVTTLNPLYKRREIEHQLGDCRPAVAFAAEETADLVSSALGRDQQLHLVSGVWKLGEKARGEPDTVPVDAQRDVAALPYSSGTTGMPKGVMLTHHNLVANIHQLLSPGPIGPNSVMIDSCRSSTSTAWWG